MTLGRLTRQGRADPRLGLKFEDMFKARLNQSRTPTPLTAFVSHTKGLLKQRQQFAVNVAFWCLAERRCDCNCDPCACGSLVLFSYVSPDPNADSSASPPTSIRVVSSSPGGAGPARSSQVTAERHFFKNMLLYYNR